MQTPNLLKRLAVISTAVFMMLIWGCEPTVVNPYTPPSPRTPSSPTDTPFFKANAGPDIVISIPVTEVELNASASLDTGRVVTNYTWRQISGESVYLGLASGMKNKVTGFREGVYVFELKASSSKYGNFSLDTVKVTVIDAFALGKVPVMELLCDTVLKDEKEQTYYLPLSAYVDSAGIRYYFDKGFTVSQLSGPNTAAVTTMNSNLSNFIQLGNLSRGTYTFRVEAERRGLKAADTLVLRLITDTAKGKEYIVETTWKLASLSLVGGSGNNNMTLAEAEGVAGLLLNKTTRQYKIFLAEENSTAWKEWTTDWMMNEYALPDDCGKKVQAFKLYPDAAVVGKKVRFRIVITE